MSTLIGFFKLAKGALQEFRFGRWLFGIVALIAVIGLAKSTTYSFQVFCFGALGVFLCGGMLAVAGAAFEQRRKVQAPPGYTVAFIWFCLFAFAAWAILFTSCVFFSYPKSPEKLFGLPRSDSWFQEEIDPALIRRPKLVKVPAGKFILGTSPEEAEALYRECQNRFPKPQDCALEYFTDESPALEVNVDEFWIDDIEVTQYAYWEAVEAGVCEPPRFKPPVIGPNKPVVGVRWIDAFNYCKFRGKRLPTEAEWEKAARWDPQSKVTFKYPWGNDPISCDKAHYGRDPQWSEECRGTNQDPLANVTDYEKGKSFVGAYNMVGNAWELVFDDYHRRSKDDPTDNPRFGAGFHRKTIKGGGWGLHSVWSRPADRYYVEENMHQPNIGFRSACSYQVTEQAPQ